MGHWHKGMGECDGGQPRLLLHPITVELQYYPLFVIVLLVKGCHGNCSHNAVTHFLRTTQLDLLWSTLSHSAHICAVTTGFVAILGFSRLFSVVWFSAVVLLRPPSSPPVGLPLWLEYNWGLTELTPCGELKDFLPAWLLSRGYCS